MSDEPQTSGTRPAREGSTALQQPQGSVEMRNMDNNSPGEQSESRDLGSIVYEDDETPQSTQAKDKGIAKPSDGDDDSLSIKPTTADGDSLNSDLICQITLLLPTGKRHPFRIDEKYLTKRNVEIPDFKESGEKDPFSVSVYVLKELILREWRAEWESKPSAPSSIRLIHFGKLMDDKMQLREYKFTAESPNVVHMSVKPAELTKDEPAGKNAAPGNQQGQGRRGCCNIL